MILGCFFREVVEFRFPDEWAVPDAPELLAFFFVVVGSAIFDSFGRFLAVIVLGFGTLEVSDVFAGSRCSSHAEVSIVPPTPRLSPAAKRRSGEGLL